MLAKTVASQSGRTSDCSSHDPIRKLIDIAKANADVGSHSDNVLLGDDNRLYFIDPLIRLKKPAPEVIEHLTGTTLLCA